MKKIFPSRLFWITFISLFPFFLKAQNPTYLLELRNDVQVSSKVYEFDIYLLRTGTTPIEYASGSYGITINPLIKNLGGTITASMVVGSPDPILVSSNQTPNTISFYDPTNVIRISGRAPPGAGNGAQISNISPGTRICRVRLSNTVDFAQDEPDLTWTTTAYPTAIYAYVEGTSIPITNTSNHTTNNLINPTLNTTPPPTAFSVTGTGSYCEGSGGLAVGLSGSEAIVTYTLYKDGAPQVPTVPGSGSAITFGTQLEGLYTVKGTSLGGTTDMTGSAVLTENPNATILLTSGTSTQTVCINSPITNIVYAIGGGGTLASATGLPLGLTGNFNSGNFTISGSPSQSGTFNYTVTTTGTCTQASLGGTITVNPNASILLTTGSSTQTVCQNSAIGNIVYAVSGGGTSAGVTGLPLGLTGNFNSGNFTISGSPSQFGTFNYTVTTTGTCTQASLGGTLTVNVLPTASAGSALTAICQGGTSSPLGGSVGGSATGGTWSTASGGTFSPNATTLNATWLPPAGFSGTAILTLTSSGGSCGSATASKTQVVNPNAVILLTSGSSTQTVCQNSAIGNIVYAVSGGGTSAGVTGLPLGLTGNFNSGNFTISGSPSQSGTFNYTVTTTGTCTQASLGGTITVNPNASIVLTTGSSTQTVCQNSAIGNIVYAVSGGGTSAGVTGLPLGLTGNFNSGNFTISGSPSQFGTFNYTVTTTGTCTQASLGGTLTVNVLPTASAGSALTAICQGGTSSPLGGSVGGSATGGTWSTASGGTFSPNATTLNATWLPPAGFSGTAILTLTSSGGSCGSATASKTQVVNPNAVILLTSGSSTQTVCQNSAIGNIVYAVSGGGTSAGVTGLPLGLTGNFNSGNFTISGSPSQSGTFNYTVTTTGTCTQASLGGTITVNPNASIVLTTGSSTQTVCQNSAIGNIVYAVSGGGTSAGVTGLPLGLTGNFNSGNFTISGSPSQFGTFNYTVTTTGTCTQASLGGTLTVNVLPTASAGSALTAICQGGTSSPLGGSVGGSATGGTWSTASGGTFSPNATTLNATWLPPAGFSGTAILTLTSSGGSCGSATASKTQVVNPNAVILLTSGSSTQTVCQNSAIGNIVYAVSGGGTSAGVTGLPLGLTGNFNSGNFTISGSPSQSGTFNYTVTTTGTCTQASLGGTITVNPNASIVLTTGSSTQTVCQNSAIGNIVYAVSGGGTSAGVTGLPLGLTGNFNSGNFTISGSPSQFGTFNYTVTTTGTCTQASLGGTLTVNVLPTASAGSALTAICQGGTSSPLGGSVGGSATGGTWSTASGGTFSPNATTLNATWLPPAGFSGTAILTLTSSGGSCGSATASKTQVVNPNAVILLTSGSSTQTVCQNSAIGNIVYAVSGGGTSAGVTGLPLGLTGNFNSGNFTISGSPSQSGTFNYTVTTTGTCTQASLGGTITVNPNASIVLTTGSSTQTVCQNSAIGNIVYAVSGGGTSAGVTGLPLGLTGNFNSGNFTISGSPSQFGTFNYTVTTTGTCTQASLGGTLTVNVLPTASAGSALTAICQGGTSSPLGGSVGGSATGGTWSTASGGTFSPNATTLNATWLPPAGFSGTAILTLTSSGGSCGSATASKTQVVNPNAVILLTSGSSTQTVCQNSAIGNIVYAVSGGGTSAGVTGLPLGLTGNFNSGNFTISGSPSQSGTFNYTVTTTGTCTQTSATGTITVRSLQTANAGTDQIGSAMCGLTSTTLAGNIPTEGNGTWSIVSGAGGTIAIPTSPTSGFSGTAGTTYVLRWTISNSPCTASSDDVTITFLALPPVTLSSNDSDNIFCQGTTVQFIAGGGVLYNFKVGGVSVQNGPSNTYTTSTLTNGQTVSVTATSSEGCVATSPEKTNFVNDLPFIVVSGSPVCAPDLLTYSLEVTVSPGTVTTAPAQNVVNISGNIWRINNVPSGTNIIVSVSNINNCVSTVSITAPNCSCPVIQAPVSGGDKSYCEGGTIPTLNVTVAAGETADWYSAPSAGTLLRSGSLSYTPIVAGTYYVLARNISSACVSSTRTAVTVIMNPLPVPSLSSSDSDNKFCAGTSITFTAEGGGSYNFRVNGSSVQSGPSNKYTTSSLTNNQIVDVIITNSNNCIATSDGITNTVYALPVPTLSSSETDNSFCAGTSVTFTAGGGSTYNFRVAGVSMQSGASNKYITTTLANNQVVDVIVTSSNGCSVTSASITNTVYDLPVSTLMGSDSDNTICAGTSVTFTADGGPSYNFRVGGVSVQNGTSNIYTTTSLTNNQVVDVIVTNSNGCIVTSSGILTTVYQVPVANGGPGGSVCDLDFVLHAVPSVGTGTWTQTSGTGTSVFTPGASSANATVTVTLPGTYIFTWTEVNNGCSSSSAVTVNFYRQPVAEAGTGGTNCGPVFRLSAIPSVGTGTWTRTSGPGSAVFAPNANTATANVTVSAYGTYTFRWTEVNGTCSANESITVSFLQAPTPIAGADASVCDLKHTLNAVPGSGAGAGTWSVLTGPGVAVFTPDATHPDATVSVDEYGTYDFAWTEVNGSCLASDVVRVIFRSLPPLLVSRDTMICRDGSIQLTATGTGTFHWTPSLLVNNPDIASPVVIPVDAEYFVVTLTNQFGCVSKDSVFVDVWDQPVAFAGPDTTLNYIFTLKMDGDALKLHETGLWTLESGSALFSDILSPETNVTGLSTGENILLWTVTNGICPPSSDYISITVNDFVVPTLITPNGDPNNEYFVLRGLETLGKTAVVIFDRRGAQVYKNDDYTNDWNGLDYNGNPLPDDTYFYTIRSQNGTSMSGYLVVRR